MARHAQSSAKKQIAKISWKGCEILLTFLQVVIYMLLDIHWIYKNILSWVGIIRQGLSLNNQIVRWFKRKKLQNCRTYHVDFLHVIR